MKKVILFLMLLATLVPAALAQDPGDEEAERPLLAISGFIPDSLALRDAPIAFYYADLNAMLRAEGVEPIGGMFELLGGDLWFNAMFRNQVTSVMQYAMITQEEGRELVGFNLYDVAQIAQFGAPPDDGLIFKGAFDGDAIGTALEARDFGQAEINGVTVWHHLEDYDVDLENRQMGDPFKGYLGMASRIALLPDDDDPVYIGGTASWAGTTAIVEAAQDEVYSLADAADFRALIDALEDPETYEMPVIQAIFVPPAGFPLPPSAVPNPAREGEDAMLEALEEEDLPLYRLLALADRREGERDLAIAAMLYDDAETAQAAGEIIIERLGIYDPFERMTDLNAEIEEPRIYETEDGVVLVVTVSMPIYDVEEPDDSPLPVRPGVTIFRYWFQMFVRRELFPFAISVEE